MADAALSQQVRAAAERLLAYRPRSKRELLSRLRRHFPEEAVLEAIAWLESVGLVDDRAFAVYWVESHARRPRSRSLLVHEMVGKGVAREEAEAVVQEVDEEAGALAAARKAARQTTNADYPLFRRRVGQHLQRRGFSTEVIRHALATVWRERFLDTPPSRKVG